MRARRYGIKDAEQGAEVVEMTLRCRALLQFSVTPFLQEIVRCHAPPGKTDFATTGEAPPFSNRLTRLSNDLLFRK